MAATPMSHENERELAILRARAYGPDADIALDPQAVERLAELEDLALSDAAPSASVEPPAPAPPKKQWWRRVSLSAALAATGLIGFGIGLAVPGLLPPHPDAVLRVVSSDGGGPTFGSYGGRVGEATRYENFHDLEVWSARISDGALCVLVISADTTWRRYGCSPRSLDPMADVETYPVIRSIEGLDLPIDSLVRFILRDGAVQVWIDENRADKTAGL